MRYLPHTNAEIRDMLQTIGAGDIGALFASIPEASRLRKTLNLSPALSELELRNHLRDLSRRNAHGEEWGMFLGGGSYSHYIPSAVSQLILRGEFLTAYTPYQPEISQGTLQAIFEYQTMMAELLGMEIANASQYDASTATAEAARLALNVTDRKKVLVARSLHPEYREVLASYLKNEDATIVEIPFTSNGTLDRAFLKNTMSKDTACLLAGSPNFFGVVEDLSDAAQIVHDAGGLFVSVVQEPLSLGLYLAPGETGADIAVAEGQPFGNAMSYGGPGLGVFAARREFVRSMPGRLVGETVDTDGRRGFVLTLATREQHIRREKATSNICTNVSLCALAATITMALWGREGLREIAQANFNRAEALKEKVFSIRGFQPAFGGPTFNEFVVRTPEDPDALIQKLLPERLIPGISLKRWYPELGNALLMTVTEMNTNDQIDRLTATLGGSR